MAAPIVLTMVGIGQLLQEFEPGPGSLPEEIPATGLHIDALVGGLRPGGLWRIQGPSESGRTTLALQAARTASMAGLPTVLFTPKHDAQRVTERLLCGVEPLNPLHDLSRRSPWSEPEVAKLEAATKRLRAVPLEVHLDAAHACDAWAQLLRGRSDAPGRVIVVDDYDLFAGSSYGESPDPERLRRLAQEWGATLVTTAATLGPKWGEPWSPGPLPPEWSRHADVLIHLDRPDQRGLIERSGEIDLHVVRNMYGPSACVTLAFQGHYARVVPFAAAP